MNEYYKKDLYSILDILPDADEVKIKSAYRKKARIWHPDVNSNTPESIAHFKEITEAYEVLLDVHKRSQYDILKGYNIRKETSYTSRTQAKRAYSEVNSTTTQEKQETENKSDKDSFSQNQKPKEKPEPEASSSKQKPKDSEPKGSFSHVFETILDGLFTNDGKTKETKKKVKPENGRDINLNVSIKMSEAVQGTHRTVNVLHSERCPKCEGRRFINGAKCPLCKGTGEVSIHKKLNVKVPPNIKKGAKIRIAEEGNKGYNGGKNGDLYLFIEIEESTFFRYEGSNVYCEVPITAYEAALGTTIDVPTINGCVAMKIPPNTSTGQKFRLSEQGVEDKKSKNKGDQIVSVKIEMAKELSVQERLLYEQLKNLSTQKIRENLLND